MKTFIKREREKRGIYQKDLAVELNIAPATMATYENTDRDPPLDILCQIADRFDVSLDVLVRGKEKDRSEERSMDFAMSRYEKYSPAELDELSSLIQYLRYRKVRELSEGQGSKDTP